MTQITCPAPYLPPGCWDQGKAAGADATLGGLLATIAAAAIVLVLQYKPSHERTELEQEVHNTVLSVLVSTFLSALLAAFIFGLLSGEMASFRADVLINLASPALVVGVLQFLLSIGWLLTLHQTRPETLTMAKRAFLLVNVLVILYLALDWENLLELKNTGTLAAPIYTGGGIIGAFLIGVLAWATTTRLKRRFSSETLKRMKEGAESARRCAIIALIFAAASTLLFGIISDLSNSLLQSGPDWVYYLGIICQIVFMGWFVCISGMSWPPPTKITLDDHKLLGEATPSPLKESPLSVNTGESSMKNESALENTPEEKSTPTPTDVSSTPTHTAPKAAQSGESSIAKSLRVLDNTETVMGHPRQIIDAGLIGTCIAFLITFLNMQQKAFDAHLSNAVIAFGIALPLLGWGYLQAALKPKPVPGWLILQAILIGSAVAEGVGELAAFIGLLFVLWHFSFSAFLAALIASGFALIFVPILSFIGLFIYALVNAEELAKKQQATGPAAPVQEKETTEQVSVNQ